MACSLSECALPGRAVPGVDELWGLLVKSIFSVYSQKTTQSGSWLELANRYLLWRGNPVRLEDGSLTATGILEGVGAQGQIILRETGGVKEYLGGSIRFAGETVFKEGRVHAKQDV